MLGLLRKRIESRKREKIADFGKSELDVINRHVDKILLKYPHVTKISICGSRVAGTWVVLGGEFFEMFNAECRRLNCQEKKKTSDWDYKTTPLVRDRFDNIDLVGKCREEILIYDKKKLF